jgi:hypothetical protein
VKSLHFLATSRSGPKYLGWVLCQVLEKHKAMSFSLAHEAITDLPGSQGYKGWNGQCQPVPPNKLTSYIPMYLFECLLESLVSRSAAVCLLGKYIVSSIVAQGADVGFPRAPHFDDGANS